MDSEKIKRLREAMEQILTASVRFKSENDLKIVNDEVIEKFLLRQTHVQMDMSSKLIWLAGGMGWDQFSKIHRYMVENDGPFGSTYSTWINAGLALMADKKLEFDERKHIAEEMENLIKEASQGDDNWVAGFWGQFYLEHPLRDDNDLKWLQQAEKWMELSVEAPGEDEKYDAHKFCRLADVYRQLGKLDDAARLYTLVLSWEQKGCCEETYREGIQKRLAMCHKSEGGEPICS